MRKVLKNSSEVCHVFARQSQEEGRCSNVYFHGKEIFSYGRHFCMAKVLDSSRILITDRTYSVTTSKHMSEIRYATNHYQQLYVPHPEGNFADNMKVWKNRIQAQFDILKNSRKRPETKEKAKNELAYIVSNIEKYLDWTGQKMYCRNKAELKEFKLFFETAKGTFDLSELSDKLAKRAKLNEAINRRRVKVEMKKQEENLQRWLNGENVRTYSFNYIEKVYLRLNDDNVETSKGAIVTLKAAKVLFELINAGKDVKGFDIDGYTVISMNGVLTVGCHKIEREEIFRFAKTQNWI